MSQKVNLKEEDDMLPEYDFTQGVRGKQHEAYRAGTNVVLLDLEGKQRHEQTDLTRHT